MSLQIRSRENAGVTVLDLEGELIFEHCLALPTHIKSLLTAGKKKLVLNMARVPRSDSAGLGCLASSFASVNNQQGKLKLIGPTPRVREALVLTRLDQVMEIFATEAEAVRSFR